MNFHIILDCSFERGERDEQLIQIDSDEVVNGGNAASSSLSTQPAPSGPALIIYLIINSEHSRRIILIFIIHITSNLSTSPLYNGPVVSS